MRTLARIACCAYWLLLAALLLTPDLVAIAGLHAVPVFPWGRFGIHLLAFTGLSFLTHAARWPQGIWWPLIVVLVIYGIATELLLAFVTPRTPWFIDGLENIAGVALGTSSYALVRRVRQVLGRKYHIDAAMLKAMLEDDLPLLDEGAAVCRLGVAPITMRGNRSRPGEQ